MSHSLQLTQKQNKSLSGNFEAVLALQGIGYVTRKLIGAATVTLHVKQYTEDKEGASGSKVTHIDIDQTLTGGVKGTTEKRTLDGEFREHSDWMFGKVRGRSTWASAADVAADDAFLAAGWEEGEAERAGPAGETHVASYVESLDNGWVARQVWGFQIVEGERRYARNIVVTKGDKRVEVRLVYDYIGADDDEGLAY